eukprot:m.471540 g.471540  ORF g.471540 m.471540 type:complete len:141 (-) comp31193_c0_seq1:885-1307(-)
MTNIYNRRAAYKLVDDAGPFDWLKWGIQEGSYTLGSGFLSSGRTAVTFEPDRFGAYFRLCIDPANATERDVYTVVCSGRNSTLQAPRTNWVPSPRRPQLGRICVNDLNVFNPRYRDMTFSEACAVWQQHPQPLDDASSQC